MNAVVFNGIKKEDLINRGIGFYRLYFYVNEDESLATCATNCVAEFYYFDDGTLRDRFNHIIWVNNEQFSIRQTNESKNI